ncbi:MAG: WYL domain-containing protein, partial [Demequinaceae bacterium]|nr:WYL domain-containing protein [Demequinaceae bacterium]
ATLRDAIDAAKIVELEYVDANDKRTVRVIEPHRLVVIDGATYVECFCRRAQDYRTLRLDRIAAAGPGPDPVVTRPSESGGFSLVPQYQAVVEAHRPARWLLESFPGTVIEDDGELVRATFGVADASVMAARLLAIGPHLRSIAPVALADEVARQARAVLAAQA